ncbi:aminotransferase [Gordonia phage RedWattleHog]|uniref:Aminotransferase n=1 Tax=Gordonia phage Stormageddon TaxID=2656541 RepID=A0A649VQZ2_9CAUD|nr:aminotransferase [Gordonia phage Stormageddon]QGJ94930.1 aminotransferase [Gordonia phage Stormageddon]QLF83574.1 aminotransferase [Gordonia phage RedWattleHog]
MTTPDLQQQFTRWRETYDRRVDRPAAEPPLVVGAKHHFLMTSERQALRDFTGGGGLMPVGHAQDQVVEAVTDLAQHFYQLGPFGDLIQGIQMEYLSWLSKHFHPEWRFRFYSSENEALMLVGDAVGVAPWELEWINREPPLRPQDTHPKGGTPKAVLVSPVDPLTYQEVDENELNRVALLHEQGVKVVWDETVLGMGWRGTSVFGTPHYADAVVLGGALGGGMPLAAIGGRDLSDTWSEDRTGGSGLAFTAGLHTLRQLMVQSSKPDMAHIVERLDDELNRLPVQLDGFGLLRSLRFPTDRIADEFVGACRRQDVLLSRHGNFVRIAFPTICELQDVDDLIVRLTEALKEIEPR